MGGFRKGMLSSLKSGYCLYAPMANSLLSTHMVACLGLVEGIDYGQFNACEAWIPYSITESQIHVRLCDLAKGRRFDKVPDSMIWAYAWDESFNADGIELELTFPISILSLSSDDVGRLIARELPICQCA